MKFQSTLLSGLLVLCAVSGCRDRDLYGDDGPDPIDEGPSIYDLQSDEMSIGTQIDLEGVVVVTVDGYGGRTGGIYVMEPEGGPYSGVFVFLQDDSVTGDLRPGDLVDIAGGVKDEFALSADESGRTLTELSPPDGGDIRVTKVGAGRVPDPVVLLPQELAASDDEAEKWEGVLIKFEDVRLLNAPRSATNSDDTLFEFQITGPFMIQSSLSPFPESIVRDDCLSSITGIGDYFFEYKILPRTMADVETGGDGCTPLEADDTLCADGEDNDYDGFADCEDFGCLSASVACPTTSATVVQIQTGAIAVDTRVHLENVVVTAVDREGTDEVYVQDAGAAGPNKGIVVRMPSSTTEAPTELVLGATVDIDGTIDEFASDGAVASLTQLAQPEFNGITPGTAPAPLMGTSVTTLTDPGDPGEPFEGAFVRIERIEVMAEETNGRVTTNDGATDVVLGPNFFPNVTGMKLVDQVVAGDCLTVTGVMTQVASNGVRLLLPRGTTDIVKLASSDCD